MDTPQKRVKLSGRELAYLKSARFLPASLVQALQAAQAGEHQECTLLVSRDVAENFRSVFTDRLAEVGFGTDYEPTIEGRMLEELIDRFYLGASRDT